MLEIFSTKFCKYSHTLVNTELVWQLKNLNSCYAKQQIRKKLHKTEMLHYKIVGRLKKLHMQSLALHEFP